MNGTHIFYKNMTAVNIYTAHQNEARYIHTHENIHTDIGRKTDTIHEQI